MSDLPERVNRWIEHCGTKLSEAEHDNDEEQARFFRPLKGVFLEVQQYIDATERRLRPLPKGLGDLSDLPPDLLKELSVAKTDELEEQLIDVIRALGGTADLDEILVGLFRKFRVEQKRRFIQNKLYRMGHRGLVESVPKKKGVYALPKTEKSPLGASDLDPAELEAILEEHEREVSPFE